MTFWPKFVKHHLMWLSLYTYCVVLVSVLKCFWGNSCDFTFNNFKQCHKQNIQRQGRSLGYIDVMYDGQSPKGLGARGLPEPLRDPGQCFSWGARGPGSSCVLAFVLSGVFGLSFLALMLHMCISV